MADEFAQNNGGTFGVWEAWDDGNVCHARVGCYRANALGLHDMHGNVWEWCLDGHDANFYEKRAGSDPVSPWLGSAARVYRGGTFGLPASSARSANRYDGAPEYRDNGLGVRPARALQPGSLQPHPSGK
jgi:formylglycine-generating enzyme required for sulfatase activity